MKHAGIHLRCASDDSHNLHQVESASSSVAGDELANLFCEARVTTDQPQHRLTGRAWSEQLPKLYNQYAMRWLLCVPRELGTG